MLLRNFLNEFELDWAQAPVRSELIQGKTLKKKRILLIGEQMGLQNAIEWSFCAWNDAEKAEISVMQAQWDGTELKMVKAAGEGKDTGFSVEDADYVILTGFCCQEIAMSVMETLQYLRMFGKLLDKLTVCGHSRVLLLSDGRVYGTLGHEFAASEYEAGATDPSQETYKSQYVLQMLESMLVSWGKEQKKEYNILRTGWIYGPYIPMMRHALAELAEKTAQSEFVRMMLTPERSSYICIHDVLTAIQFVLTKCPKNKIFNVSGKDSNASPGQIAMLLYQNFPEQCRMQINSDVQEENGMKHTEAAEQKTDVQETTGGLLLNTQLLCHYGFEPQITLEDGLIILVKSLQNSGEVFIFDNTYLGKLEKVQQILLGYLLEVDRICRKHNIKYFLAGGTLLGAIRHHGFIPWDDDADVMMLREDYDKFQEVVQQELPDNIFLQLPETEKGNYNPFTKLRINNTMFATEFTGHFMDMHNGIFFDILSHDRTGNHKWSQKLHLMVTMLTRSVVFNKWGNTDVKGGGKHPVICKIVSRAKDFIPMPFALWAQNQSLEFFKNRKTEYLYDGMGRNLKRGAFPAKWLEEAVYVDFEGYQFPVPKEYDRYLTYLYGDYMQMIPVSQRRTSHSIVLTDLGEYGNYHLPKR